MNISIIFDNDFEIQYLKKLIKNKPASIHLFPLTSNFLIIEKIKKELASISDVKIKEIDSAKYINDEVNALQQNIHKWSCTLGNEKIGKKTLKEWLLLPDGSGSSWWFGLLSEKNSVQDNAFFKIAQINAVKKLMEKDNNDFYFIGMSDPTLKKIFIKIARILKKKTYSLTVTSSSNKKNIKTKLLHLINGIGLFGAFLSACLHWGIWLRDSRQARHTLPSLKKRLQAQNPFVFITYFPNVDDVKAHQGIFRNKYALPLQDKLNELQIPVTWLVMPVFYNGHNFKSAMSLAKKFLDNGEKLFVLQEFFTIKIFLQAFIWWIRQTVLGYCLFKFVDKKKLIGNLTDKAAMPIVKYLWWHSFIGTSSVRGIIFYLTYREIFKSLPDVKNCLYFCEMQAWEKALNIARNQINPQIKTLAFQHTVVMRNFFNYFYDHNEICRNKEKSDMPLPDILLANGKVTYSLLAESNYPNLYEAEAIRQLYLANLAKNEFKRADNQPVLLVVGSCDSNETKSLITMLFTAFPKATEFSICFKGSPVNPVEPLFAELGIDISQTNYKILHDDVSKLLRFATVALVANTTVSIEAFVCGCAVIIPIFADTMLLNPIVDTEAQYHLVSTANELKRIVEQTMVSKKNQDVTKECIESYWNIDTKLPLWTKILETFHYASQ